MKPKQRHRVALPSYFAVADIVIDSLEEATKFYDSESLMFIKNKNINNVSTPGSFF